MVQVAWVVFEGTEKVAEESVLVQPEGFEIPGEATEVHGITTEEAQTDGIPLQQALDQLDKALGPVEMVVAHNVDFDIKTLAAEYYRQGWADRDSWDQARPPVQKQSLACTMKSGTSLCGLRREEGSGYKWPSLQELHHELFGEPVENAHDALADVRACARCFFEMKEREVDIHA